MAVPEIAAPTGQFNHAVRANGLVLVSGQVPLDRSGRLVGPGVQEQARQVFENLGAVLSAAGAGFGDLLRLTTYIASAELAQSVAEVRRAYLVEPWPASTMVVAGLLSADWLVEVDAIAAAP